jgi:hypothetical protein
MPRLAPTVAAIGEASGEVKPSAARVLARVATTAHGARPYPACTLAPVLHATTGHQTWRLLATSYMVADLALSALGLRLGVDLRIFGAVLKKNLLFRTEKIYP